MMRYWAAIIAAVSLSGTGIAGEKPLYDAIPSWVRPAPPIDATNLGETAPVVLLYDNQQRLQDGQVWSYVDSATRIATTQMLTALGTLQLAWQPAHGDLIVHRAEIIRGSEHINLLKGEGTFSVLRREQQIERRVLTGVLTATLSVEGLRVGDVLHISFSATTKDPTLKGNMQSVAPIIFDPFRTQFARVRFLWPKGTSVQAKGYADALAAAPVLTSDGLRDFTVNLPLAKPAELPADAPGRFQKLPIVEASSFRNWADVATVMAPLYVTSGRIEPTSQLASEVAKIIAADSDPVKRAANALQLVQDKVRYLMLGMDSGNYVPETPAQTWSLRYGDCKAKTLLLLAMLHVMKIDAEPVLAHTQYGDQVSGRLPSAAAFNHVLVRATINGETFWLDGTGNGTRLADIRDTPPLGSVLPIRATGAVLMPIALRANARADMATTLDLDQSAGINLPTPFRVTSVFRGGQADMLRAISAQGSADDVANALDPLAKTYIDGATVVTRAVSFDDAAATATMVATGVAYPGWAKENDRHRIALSALVQGLSFAPDRARPAWRTIPVATGPLTNISLTARIRLPDGGKGFSIEGNPSRTETIAGHNITQTASQSGDTVTITTQRRTSGIEIPFEGLAEARKQFALSTTNPIRIVAPATYPPFWQEIEQAKQAHRLDPVHAAYQARITEKPTEYSRYTDRAWFLDRIYERTAAIADLTKALAIEPSVETYLKRARSYFATGDKAKAMADTKAAYDLDPSSLDVLDALARVKADTGDRAGALALLQERADTGGDGKDNILATIAEMQADGGDKDAAMATIDAAIAQYPGKPALLNSRCWLKGLLNVALDTALRDCTKSIELSESPIAALDSRAMVYYRMNRLDDARVDLDTVLAREPNLSASLFMRAVIRKRAGDAKAGDADLAAARLIEPRIAEKYARYGIKP